MLVHLLRSHPDCVSNSEVVALTDSIGGFDPAVRDQLAALGTDDELVAWRKRDPVDFMNRTAFLADGHLWSGFKMKSDELVQRKYAGVLAALRADTSLKILHLNRSNLLDRYMSWVMVNKVTGVTLATREQDRPEFEAVTISPKKAEKDFVLAEERQARLDEWFGDHEVLQLDYDELTTDAANQSARICSFLDIEERLLTTRTVKLSPHVSTLIANFDEVRAYFDGTRFSHLFSKPDEDGLGRNAATPVSTAPLPAADAYRIPGQFRQPSREWGRSGTPFHSYVAAVCNIQDLSQSNVLAVGDHTDMIEAIARSECDIERYIGLEASSSFIAHIEATEPDDRILLFGFDPNAVRDDTQWLLNPKPDLVVVTAELASMDAVIALVAGLARSVRAEARMMVQLPDAWGEVHDLREDFERAGWRLDEVRPPRRFLRAHAVCTALPGA